MAAISAPAMARRWWAVRGEGAVARDHLGERPIHVSSIDRLEEAQLLTSGLGPMQAAGFGAAVAHLDAQVWRDRGFGDFWGYMLVAEGAAEVMLEIGPTLWDLAAPSLIVEEAGGRLTDFAGTRSNAGPQVLATNGRLHDAIVAALAGVSVGRGRWSELLMAVVPIALAIFTFLVLVEPNVKPAIVNLRLALAIDAVATLVAVAVAILGWVRFREGGDEAALWRASALLVLGTINGLMAAATIFGVGSVSGFRSSSRVSCRSGRRPHPRPGGRAADHGRAGGDRRARGAATAAGPVAAGHPGDRRRLHRGRCAGALPSWWRRRDGAAAHQPPR